MKISNENLTVEMKVVGKLNFSSVDEDSIVMTFM